MLFTIKANNSEQTAELSGMAQSVGYSIAIFWSVIGRLAQRYVRRLDVANDVVKRFNGNQLWICVACNAKQIFVLIYSKRAFKILRFRSW